MPLPAPTPGPATRRSRGLGGLARPGIALLILACVGLWGCDAFEQSADLPIAGPPLGPLEPGAIRYICSEFPFDPAILEAPANDEQADTRFAAALRALIEPPVRPHLPKTGWHLLGSDDDSAEFVTGSAQDGLTLVAVEPWEGLVRAVEYGSCQPELVYLPPVRIAEWEPDPEGRLGRDTTTFVALVTERECASGQAAIGRIVAPTLAFLDDRVLIAFGTVPPVGDGVATCQGNPPVPIRVDLGQPLGDRVLVDPAIWPPKEFPAPN